MPKIINKTFGDLVAKILDERGLSLRAAWYKTGVHYNTIHNMRNGIIPSRGTIESFADGMSIDRKELLIAAGYEESTDPIQAVNIALRRAAPTLTDHDIEQVLQVVREVTEEVDGESCNNDSKNNNQPVH